MLENEKDRGKKDSTSDRTKQYAHVEKSQKKLKGDNGNGEIRK